MENYYFITEDSTKTGVPIYLEAGLYEEFIEKEKYIKNYAFPPLDIKITPVWRRAISINNPVQMPEKLFLINKHRQIDFDVYYKEEGFIVSNKFKDVIDSNKHPQYVAFPLEIRTREGECNAKKEYWYIKFIEPCQCIDFSKSNLKIFNNNSNETQPKIDKYLDKIVLNSKYFSPKELFCIDNTYFNNYLFCNREMMEYIVKSKIKTIKIIDMELLFDYLYDARLINKKTKMIII